MVINEQSSQSKQKKKERKKEEKSNECQDKQKQDKKLREKLFKNTIHGKSLPFEDAPVEMRGVATVAGNTLGYGACACLHLIGKIRLPNQRAGKRD